MTSTGSADARTAWRLRVYPIAIVVALAGAVLLGAINAAGSAAPGSEVGGDFPAFYGAGSIAAAGDLDELHDPARQVIAQAGLHRTDEGEVSVFFPYPAQVAVVYQPLAALEYHWAYLVHTLFMATALLGAIWLARPMIPWLHGRVTLAFAAALLFWPMFRTVSGGSNTAFTLLLITAAWRLVHDDRQLLAGLVLAGLLFKPQLAIPVLGLFLLGRYWNVVAGSVVGAAFYYLWGTALLGWGWAWDWVEMARDFGAQEAEINGHSSISFIGFGQNLFGVGFKPPTLIAWALAASMALLLSWLWWRRDRSQLKYLLALTVPGVLLLAPHVMTHDGSLVVLTAAVVVGAWPARIWRPWVAGIWVLGAIQLMIKPLGFSPGFLMLLIVFASAWSVMQRAIGHSPLVANSAGRQSPAGAEAASENSR